ncbi:helix-turn-helix domain-containing protein [Aurantivibrio infirmus]
MSVIKSDNYALASAAMSPQKIPVYKLYGESAPWATAEPLHYEDIQQRSALFNWEISPHRHDNLSQLIYVKNTSKMTLDGNHINLIGPSVVVIPPLTVHGFTFNEEASGHVVSFPQALLHELLALTPNVTPQFEKAIVLELSKDKTLRKNISFLLDSFASEYQHNRAGKLSAMMSLLTLLLVMISREVTSEHINHSVDRYKLRMDRFSHLVTQHYKDAKPISFYAKKLGVSTSQLNNTCKKETGQSAQRYIHMQILLEAKRLLAYTDLQITEIAYSLGFNDPAYFTRFVHKYTNESPSFFRRSHRRPDQLM